MRAVLAALDVGQRLPAHVVVLVETAADWPASWRPLLARLTIQPAPPAMPAAAQRSALRAAQGLLLGEPAAVAGVDASLRVASARSRVAACQALAAMLAANPAALPGSAIVCEDEDTALLLDGALSRLGVPTTGAERRSAALPPLQVLPLVLALCWEPVDPAILQQFFTLPETPFPREAAWPLARALSEQPGLGSGACDDTRASLTAPDRDPQGELAARIAGWLDHPRARRGFALPTSVVAERCGKVAQWAMGRAMLLEQRGEPPALAEAFRTAAAQAKALGELAQAQGATITEPQLERRLDAVRSAGASLAPHPALAGGPVLVASLADVPGGTNRLVWLGLGTTDARPPPWSPGEIAALRRAGLDVDDGARALRVRRAAERAGFARVQGSTLLVRVPQDRDQRPHPLWLQLRAALPEAERSGVALEDALDMAGLAPWSLAAIRSEPIAPPRVRDAWVVPAELLPRPASVSATELATRLGCPLKWTLHYGARLRPGATAELPGDFLLKGKFSHAVLERVFLPGEAPDPDAVRASVARVFDERLPLDAAPLAQPAQAGPAARLRAELLDAGARLAELLRDGGYTVVRMEQPLDGTQLLGLPATGAMDCVLRAGDGSEAVLDVKYAGNKYRDKLAEGSALQLAVYAAARSAQTGRTVDSVGYLVIQKAQVYAARDSPLRGLRPEWHERGPSIQQTWARLQAALDAAGDWLDTGRIPARPLQDPGAWPRDAHLAIELQADGSVKDPCQYCAYGKLCGKEDSA
ncbi:MAG: PD-(D/E)XK nuclease family protein [Halobacteriales archaeon]|nr:PD-(D/E)XK nuclease family protein [Halobacteriales archaeon]